ncbi:MAG: Gfo/Idh/MocA family oxidoreductase [Bacteroidales bacterium]|nr:Gfo/Idh/MocA family oxidoreductase [Bacteroidales bacterium]
MKKKYLNSRRAFIRTSATGLIGASLISAASPAPFLYRRKKEKLGIALIGLGYYSTDLLAPALQETEHVKLTGIVTGTPEKEKIWSEKYNIPEKNIYNYENFDDIANNQDIDIVYVVLPNSMHKEFTIRGANAGKHVICEKPMAMNAVECREMIDACNKNGVLLSIGYRLHYDPYNIEAMRLGQEKVFGNVLHISCGAAFRNTSTEHWKLQRSMGGGSMMDMGVYPLQAARYVTGEEPVSVTAQSYTMRESCKDIEEAVNFQLTFPGGTIANLSTGFHAGFNYLLVSAERGRFELQPYSGYRGIKGKTSNGELSFPKMNQQAAHMDDFALSVRDGQPVRVPGEEGLKDMIVVDAAYKAMKNNCAVSL